VLYDLSFLTFTVISVPKCLSCLQGTETLTQIIKFESFVYKITILIKF